MKKLTICVDMDDTIENLLSAWLIWLNKKYNYNVKLEDVTEWELLKFYPTISQQQLFEPLNTREFWKTVTPKEDAIIYLKKLMDNGHKVFICTSSHYDTLMYKMQEVLEIYFPYITWKQIIVTANKQMVDCDVLIDDGIHNLIGGKYYKILFDAIHNRSFNEDSIGAIRTKNWEEVYSAINVLSRA